MRKISRTVCVFRVWVLSSHTDDLFIFHLTVGSDTVTSQVEIHQLVIFAAWTSCSGLVWDLVYSFDTKYNVWIINKNIVLSVPLKVSWCMSAIDFPLVLVWTLSWGSMQPIPGWSHCHCIFEHLHSRQCVL